MERARQVHRGHTPWEQSQPAAGACPGKLLLPTTPVGSERPQGSPAAVGAAPGPAASCTPVSPALSRTGARGPGRSWSRCHTMTRANARPVTHADPNEPARLHISRTGRTLRSPLNKNLSRIASFKASGCGNCELALTAATWRLRFVWPPGTPSWRPSTPGAWPLNEAQPHARGTSRRTQRDAGCADRSWPASALPVTASAAPPAATREQQCGGPAHLGSRPTRLANHLGSRPT